MEDKGREEKRREEKRERKAKGKRKKKEIEKRIQGKRKVRKENKGSDNELQTCTKCFARKGRRGTVEEQKKNGEEEPIKRDTRAMKRTKEDRTGGEVENIEQ